LACIAPSAREWNNPERETPLSRPGTASQETPQR